MVWDHRIVLWVFDDVLPIDAPVFTEPVLGPDQVRMFAEILASRSIGNLAVNAAEVGLHKVFQRLIGDAIRGRQWLCGWSCLAAGQGSRYCLGYPRHRRRRRARPARRRRRPGI